MKFQIYFWNSELPSHDGDSAVVKLRSNVDFNSLAFGTQPKSIFHTPPLCVRTRARVSVGGWVWVATTSSYFMLHVGNDGFNGCGFGFT